MILPPDPRDMRADRWSLTPDRNHRVVDYRLTRTREVTVVGDEVGVGQGRMSCQAPCYPKRPTAGP